MPRTRHHTHHHHASHPHDPNDHSHRPVRKKQQSTVFWVSLLAGVPIAWILIIVLQGALSPSPDLASRPDPTIPEEPTTKPKFSATNQALEERAQAIARAIEGGDEKALESLVSFSRMHDARVKFDQKGKEWRLLSTVEQQLAKKQMTEVILGNEDVREFLKDATRETFNLKANTGLSQLELVHANSFNPKLKQRRNIQFYDVNGLWYVTDVVTDAGVESTAEVSASSKEPVDVAKQVEQTLATIERQEHLASTSADMRAKINDLAAKLGDLKLTTEAHRARNELVIIGNAAVPALLNLIVEHKDLKTMNDLIIVNQVVQVLREVTDQDYRFIMGTDAMENGAQYATNLKELQRWFTWWRMKKG